MLARMLWQVWESLAPVFLAIAVGALLRALRFLPDAFFGGLNKLAFWVCLPCLLFHEIAHCQVTVEGAWRMAPWILALTIIPQLLAGWLLAKLLRVPAPSRSAFLQGGMRANLAYVGIPVITFALARNPQAAGLAALTLAPVTTLYNVVSVLLLTRRAQTGATRWGNWRAIFLSIAGNPLILSCLLGLLFFAARIPIPHSVDKTIDLFGKGGLPTALLALGAGLSLARVRGHFLHASAASLVRVAGGPLFGWWIAGWFGVTGDMRLLLLLFSACPTAVASYVMADQMGADKNLAAAIVVLSTLYSFAALAAVILLA
jgi:predicted permease